MMADLMWGSLQKMNYKNAPILDKNLKFGLTVLTTNMGHHNLKGKRMIKVEELPEFRHGIEVDRVDDDVDYMLFYLLSIP